MNVQLLIRFADRQHHRLLHALKPLVPQVKINRVQRRRRFYRTADRHGFGFGNRSEQIGVQRQVGHGVAVARFLAFRHSQPQLVFRGIALHIVKSNVQIAPFRADHLRRYALCQPADTRRFPRVAVHAQLLFPRNQGNGDIKGRWAGAFHRQRGNKRQQKKTDKHQKKANAENRLTHKRPPLFGRKSGRGKPPPPASQIIT